MALATATWTTATVESLSQRQIIDRFLRESGLGVAGTATTGATTNITDTVRLKNTSIRDTEFDGDWARVSYDAGGASAAPEGEIRACTAFVPGTGVATVDAFSVAVAAGDGYQFFHVMHPQDVLDHLDVVMKEDIFLPDWTLLTEVPDGDMEQANTSDWAVTSAARSKSSAEPAMNGKRWLLVTTSGANGYAETANNISVFPGKRYHCSALLCADDSSSTAKLVLYDKTNSAELGSVSVSSLNPVRAWLEVAVPATCLQVGIRLVGVQNGANIKADDVCFFCMDDRDVLAPWWSKKASSIKQVFRTSWDSIGTNLYSPVPRLLPDTNRWDYRDTAFGRGQARMASAKGTLTGPVAVFGIRNETAFSNANTDLKHCDANHVQAALGRRVFEQLSSYMNSGNLDRAWALEKLAYYTDAWRKCQRDQENRLEELVQSSVGDGQFFSHQWNALYSADRLVR